MSGIRPFSRPGASRTRAWALWLALAAAAGWSLPAILAQDPSPASEDGGRALVPPLRVAPTAEEALDYNEGEKNILSAVRDGGTWNSTAFYVLLRRASMLPEGRKTVDAAEQPNFRMLLKEPQHYRGRLVRFQGEIKGFAQEWTPALTDTKWWSGKMYTLPVIESTTGQRVFLGMAVEPHRGISLNQKLQFAGIFYKLATFSEIPHEGTTQKVNLELPVVIAREVYATQGDYRWTDVPWPVAIVILALAALAAAFFMLLRRRNQQLPGPRDAIRRRRLEALAEDADPDAVDEELKRQVEAFKARQRPGQTDDDRAQNPR